MNNLRDDLRWYLLDEHIEDLKKMGHPEQKANIYTNKNNWLNVYYKWHPVISSIEFSAKIGYPVLSSIGKNRSKDNIIITDKVLRYSSVINELSKLYKLTFLGGYPRNIQLMIKKGILYYPYYPSNLIESLLKNDYNYLSSYIEDLKDLLMKLKPKAIILYYDHLLTERAIVLAAKELEIPTIEIQHGIYNENQIITGKYAKYLFVWGEFFRDMYIKNKLRSRDEIKVLGYPLHITPNIQNNRDDITIYYLGQNFEKYNKNMLKYKIDTINTLDHIFSEMKLNFIYRPHPNDSIREIKYALPELNLKANESLSESLRKGDIFISFGSTALIEAALHSKVCIQLRNLPIHVDNYQEMGIIPASFKNIDDLKRYIFDLLHSNNIQQFVTNIDPYFIEIPKPNPGMKFLKLLTEVIEL